MGSTASGYEEFPITFEKGLVTEVEESVLEMGQAAELLNWEPSAGGGLRARNAWSSISTTGLPTNYKVRGFREVALEDPGSGLAPVVIVQETALPDGIESGAEGNSATKTCTLTGVTPGNILIGVCDLDNVSVQSPTAPNYTMRVESLSASGSAHIFTKVATDASESFVVSRSGGSGSIHHAHLFEVSGIAAVPTASSTGTPGSGGSQSFSATSVVNSGFAVLAGMQFADAAWNDAPSLTGGTTQYDTDRGGGLQRSTGVTKIYSSSTVSDTIDSGGAAAAWGVLGIWDAVPAASFPAGFYIFLAVATDTGYSVYRINRDEILTGTWELVDSATSSDASAYVSMSVGTGELIWSSKTMSNPRFVPLATLIGNNVTDLSSKSGRATAFHKDRMFVAGSSADPARLYFSGIGTPHTFTTATDFIDVGGEDGEAIEDLVSVEGLLLVCKVNRLYLISGSGIESFFVNELPGGTSSTGRPAVRTPYGTIVAGPTDIWVVQGGGVDPLSRPLGAQYSISGLVSTAYAQDVVLIADSSTGNVYRVNLVTGAWSLEEVTSGENQVGHLFSLQGRFYYGVSNSATKVGGTRRLSSARGADETTGKIRYRGDTGRMALMGPSVKYTPRYLYVQLRLQDVTKPNNLRVTVESNTASVNYNYTVTEATQREAISLGRDQLGSEWLKISFEAEASSTAAAIDIEKTVLGALQERNRP